MNIILVVSLKSYRILATASYTLLDLSDEIRHSVVVNYGILYKLDKKFIRMAQKVMMIRCYGGALIPT